MRDILKEHHYHSCGITRIRVAIVIFIIFNIFIVSNRRDIRREFRKQVRFLIPIYDIFFLFAYDHAVM